MTDDDVTLEVASLQRDTGADVIDAVEAILTDVIKQVDRAVDEGNQSIAIADAALKIAADPQPAG